MEKLQDYLKYMKKVDIVQATQEARIDSMKRIQDQGLVVMTLIISEFLANLMDKPEDVLRKIL